MPKESAMLIALKSRKSAEQTQEMPKQIVKVNYSDVPSLKEARPGDPVTIYLTGKINSSAQDGAMVEVDNFTEQEAEEPEEEKPEEKPPLVRPSIQPYPGGF